MCLFIDLFKREIVGASTGPNKDAAMVYKALSTIKGNLSDVQLFDTDCGSEFDNQLMAEVTEVFGTSDHSVQKDVLSMTPWLKRYIRASKSNLCTR